MRLFEPDSSTQSRFNNADPSQKRELVEFMCLSSVWRDGKLEVDLHDFFEVVLNSVISEIPEEEGGTEKQLAIAKSVDWWRLLDGICKI